jgi:Leucine-rich repeat (LRR) protein
VASLSELSLSGRGVAHIDNLEPFFDLRSLDLSRNAIQTVDNLYFLVKLEDLDLSYNRIADIDSLTRGEFHKSAFYHILSPFYCFVCS